MRVMKKYIILIFVLLIGMSSFAVQYLGMQLPLPGKTIADTTTQANTLGFVFSKVAKEQTRCRKMTVINTNVTKELNGVKYNQNKRKVDGYWSEEWLINACGTNIVVPIDFQIKRNGVMSTIGTPKSVKWILFF